MCGQLARDRDTFDLTEEEEPLWRLLSEDAFQDDLTDWIKAGDIREGAAVKGRMAETMANALAPTAATPEHISFLQNDYFEALDRAIFADPVLARWRVQLA